MCIRDRIPLARHYFHKFGPIFITWGLNIPILHIGGADYAEVNFKSSYYSYFLIENRYGVDGYCKSKIFFQEIRR